MLIVVPKNKVQTLRDELAITMKEYYETLDKAEEKRMTPEAAKQRLNDQKDMGEKATREWTAKH